MRSQFTVSIVTFLSICPLTQSPIFAQIASDTATPALIQTALDNLHLTGSQKEDATHLLKSYQQKQQEAQAQLLHGLENSLTPQQYQQLTVSLNPTTIRHTSDTATVKEKPSSPTEDKDVRQFPLTFTGGFDTDPRDHGRPVILIASALGVTSDVFRNAFGNVHPAGPNSGGPTDAEARRNKQVLMDALGPYGITNDRLNEVSNYYRYNRSNGQIWKHVDAAAVALVKDGKIIGVRINDAGAGYSSTPTVTIPQIPGAKLEVKIGYEKDLSKNGSLSEISVVTSGSAK